MFFKMILFLVFGAALVCNATVTYRLSKKAERAEHEKRMTDKRIEELKIIIDRYPEFAEEIKSIRLEISGSGARKPLSEEYFRDLFYIGFSENITFKDKYLEYVAKVGITSIASEIPEEKRTHDVMTEIIRRMQKDLDKNQIIKI